MPPRYARRSPLSSRRNASPGALQRPSRFCSDDVLFPGSGSGVVADTLATFVTMFCVLTCTVAVTLAPLPSGLVKVQSIAVPELATVQLPATPFGNVPPVYWYGAAEVCIVTPLAASGPLFVTVTEKVNVLVVVFPCP